jgi:hypothetical protein
MRLPQPNADEVREFARLCREHTGDELTPEKAEEVLTALLHFYYLTRGHERHEHNRLARSRAAATAPSAQTPPPPRP